MDPGPRTSSSTNPSCSPNAPTRADISSPPQFLAILAIFAPIVYYADWVMFHFRVLPTRVVHDLQPKTHRF